MSRKRALVVGAGVSGLSCAHVLLTRGYEVEIWSRDAPLETTSCIAAAFWYPYRVYPADRVADWAGRSYREFAQLAKTPDTGVSMREAIEVFPERIETPAWGATLVDFRRATHSELPPNRADGFVFQAPVVETPIYVPWLVSEVERMGAKISIRAVADLSQALAHAEVVVNASGLGARELCGDSDLHPVKGQVLMVERAGVDRVLVDEHGPDGITYVVPRSGDCVLGGCALEHVEETGIDPTQSSAIRSRATDLVPELGDAATLQEKAGLRPCRSVVRLEAVPIADGPHRGRTLVHNYGHGGAGVTLSWGCAHEVAEILATHEPSGASAVS